MMAWGGMPSAVLRAPDSARHAPAYYSAPHGLERDRLWRSRQPARLCPHGLTAAILGRRPKPGRRERSSAGPRKIPACRLTR